VIVNRGPPQSGEADRQRDVLYKLLGRKTVWDPEIPQRTVVAEALGNRSPVHAMGPRGEAVAGMFDLHYKKLIALARKRERSKAD
jgi:hypothetical protein